MEDIKMINSSGKITIGKLLAELCDYQCNKQIWWVIEPDKKNTFRLVPEEALCLDDMIVAVCKMDAKWRITVPQKILEIYGGAALPYGKREDGYIYVKFETDLDTANRNVLNSKLDAILEKLK